jgi:hypothetical protein
MKSYELLNAIIHAPLFTHDLDYYRRDIKPNIPWADDHFAERVCGYPLNPGYEWRNWPWHDSAATFLTDGVYNHTYAERYWPKWANVYPLPTEYPQDFEHPEIGDTVWQLDNIPPHKGIRNVYGDLNDLIQLLAEQPHTRQAYIPIFHPEDTGIGDNGRKPCTLGYNFIMRDNKLHIYYPIRSCDFVRHYNDDVYLTIRLALYIIEKAAHINPSWHDVKLHSFTMHCTSLHIFANDM